MTFAQGFAVSLAMGEETSFGVPPGGGLNKAWKFPIVKPGIKGSQNLIDSKALLNDMNPRKPFSGNRMVDGTVEVEVSQKSIGWLLKWLLGGTPVSTAVGTGASYVLNGAHSAGATTLLLKTGTGTLPVNTWVLVNGTPYRVATTTASPITTGFTIDGGLIASGADGDAVTIIVGYTGHSFAMVAGTTQKSLMIETAYNDISSFDFFTGCLLSKCAFKFSPEGIMSASIDTEGKQFAFTSVTTIDTLTDPGHTPFGYFGASIWQGSNLVAIAKSLDFTVDRMLDKNQFVIGPTGTRAFIPGGIAKVSGTIKVLYTGQTLQTLANAGTTTSIRADVRSGSDALSLFMPEVRFQVSTATVVSEAVVELDIPFTAFYSTNAAATAFQATLSNNVTTYAAM